jgi:hypothetical protein
MTVMTRATIATAWATLVMTWAAAADDDEHDGSDNDDSEDKALHIPFRMTPAGIMSFKCRICLGEEYDSEAKVVLHAIDVIKQDAGSLDVVEWHCQVLWARRRR